MVITKHVPIIHLQSFKGLGSSVPILIIICSNVHYELREDAQLAYLEEKSQQGLFEILYTNISHRRTLD